jgi:hypothetical protein
VIVLTHAQCEFDGESIPRKVNCKPKTAPIYKASEIAGIKSLIGRELDIFALNLVGVTRELCRIPIRQSIQRQRAEDCFRVARNPHRCVRIEDTMNPCV